MTTLAALKCHVRNPTTSVRRIGCKFYELFHPEEPWIWQALNGEAAGARPGSRNASDL